MSNKPKFSLNQRVLVTYDGYNQAATITDPGDGYGYYNDGEYWIVYDNDGETITTPRGVSVTLNPEWEDEDNLQAI